MTDRILSQREPLRVLLVDSSEDDALILRAELTARGLSLDCMRVDCEIDMAAQLARAEWDLVIADHDLPGFDALKAFAALRRSGRDIPFIIHSTHMSHRRAVSAMYDGVDDCIAKGDYERLVPVIERELRGAEARRAARQAASRIRELAYFDGLSALPNHQLFCGKVTDWLQDRERRGKAARGAVVVVDVDRFLRVNASFGYEVGSEVLRGIARRLADVLGPDVVLARLGGDTFGIFVPDAADKDRAERVARRILGVFERPFMKDRVELYLTASAGIAMAPRDGGGVYDLLMNAEAAVVQAKRVGGGAARFYERTMNAASAERLALEADLRHAIERNELFVHYQPIVDARDGRVTGAEALLRWRHAQHGVISPDQFIPLADETGLIVDIGAWVLAEACAQGQRWQRAGWRDFRLSVNASAVQFGQPRLLEVVGEALRKSGLPPPCLMLEITETSIMSDVESAGGMLRALKNMGVRVAVDDFGTGYSSLSYLKRLPIDVIKIDQSFVRHVCEDEEDAAIVRAIIALARSMRLSTVAEGVETEAQEALLCAESCDYFQGYRFGRPESGDAIVRLARLPDAGRKHRRLHPTDSGA